MMTTCTEGGCDELVDADPFCAQYGSTSEGIRRAKCSKHIGPPPLSHAARAWFRRLGDWASEFRFSLMRRRLERLERENLRLRQRNTVLERKLEQIEAAARSRGEPYR